jgi:hypothetical protein
MTRSWWKRAASFGLLLSTISLPVWGQSPKKKVCDNDSDDPKKCKQVPEGGPLYAYVVLSGLAISGGMLLVYKRRSKRVLPRS